jgi:hypothetical protein
MNIKELLLEGCVIKMSYKTKKTEWVGDINIYIFHGGYGMKPKISLNGSYAKNMDWELDQIDEAIKYFEDLVFNPKNLMYKLNESVIEFTNAGIDIDLDEEEDYDKVRTKINEKLKK